MNVLLFLALASSTSLVGSVAMGAECVTAIAAVFDNAAKEPDENEGRGAESVCPVKKASESLSADVAVFTILADEIAFGNVRVVSRPGDAPGLTSGYIELRSPGEHDKRILFTNALKRELEECENKDCTAFYTSNRTEALLVQSPRAGLYKAKVSSAEFEDTRKAVSARAKVIGEINLCSKEMMLLLKQIDGDGQQKSIDSLYNSNLMKNDKLCLAAQISSKSPIKKRTFEPPYPSSEGVYYHGFSTRGELIAFLLPHFTKIAMTPREFPLSDEERNRLTTAWIYLLAEPSGD